MLLLAHISTSLEAFDTDFEGLDVADQPVTAYRLREGIERFFITDINNPAASTKAQSDISAYYDKVWPSPDAYNHIAGGAISCSWTATSSF